MRDQTTYILPFRGFLRWAAVSPQSASNASVSTWSPGGARRPAPCQSAAIDLRRCLGWTPTHPLDIAGLITRDAQIVSQSSPIRCGPAPGIATVALIWPGFGVNWFGAGRNPNDSLAALRCPHKVAAVHAQSDRTAGVIVLIGIVSTSWAVRHARKRP